MAPPSTAKRRGRGGASAVAARAATPYLALMVAWVVLATFNYGFGISELNPLQRSLDCASGSVRSTRPRGSPVPADPIASASSSSPSASSPMLPTCFPLTPAAFGFLTSLFTLGGLVSSLGLSPLANALDARRTRRVVAAASAHVGRSTASPARMGTVLTRRRSLLLSAMLSVLGATVQALAPSLAVLGVGRLIMGLGAGVGVVTVPAYLSDISPPSLRGSLGVLNQLSIVLGILAAQALGVSPLGLASPPPLQPHAAPTATQATAPSTAATSSWAPWRYVPLVAAGVALLQVLLYPLAVDSPADVSPKRAREVQRRLWGSATAASALRDGTGLSANDDAEGSLVEDEERRGLLEGANGVAPPEPLDGRGRDGHDATAATVAAGNAEERGGEQKLSVGTLLRVLVMGHPLAPRHASRPNPRGRPPRPPGAEGPVTSTAGAVDGEGEGDDDDPDADEGELLDGKARTSRLRRGLALVAMTQLAQQLSGVNAVLSFSTGILLDALSNGDASARTGGAAGTVRAAVAAAASSSLVVGEAVVGGEGASERRAKLIALGITVVNALMTFPPIYLIRETPPYPGRRGLLLLSTTCMSASMLLLYASLARGWTWLSATCLVTSIASFSVGLGPVPFLILPELVEEAAVGAASSLGLALNWSANFLVSSAFLPLRQALARVDGADGASVFVAFAALNLLAALGVARSYRYEGRTETSEGSARRGGGD